MPPPPETPLPTQALNYTLDKNSLNIVEIKNVTLESSIKLLYKNLTSRISYKIYSVFNVTCYTRVKNYNIDQSENLVIIVCYFFHLHQV